jgi:phosphoenolpyruvate carboxykinase (GTP)
MNTLHGNCIFTNVAETDDGDVWWEGMTKEPPAHLIDWKGNDWSPDSETPAAHPNARFTVAIKQCPVIAGEAEDLQGVPISAILFGGRRATIVPLVNEARDWNHGVFMGSIVSSEKTAAATGEVGKLRHDPMAMLPFCGYNMASYWQHWVNIGNTVNADLPRIYYVNWFRKNDGGKFLWPGFGENSRVLKWIFERCDGTGDAVETPIGNLPTMDALDLSDLNMDETAVAELLRVELDKWLKEIPSIGELYARFGDRIPTELNNEIANLQARLEAAKKAAA